MKRATHSPIKPWELPEEQVASFFSEVAPPMADTHWGPTTATSSIDARAVLIRVFPEGYAVAVFPAASQLCLDEVASRLGAQLAFPATEAEIRHFLVGDTNDLEPFGSRYGLRTLMDLRLAGAPALSFLEGDSSKRVEIDMDRFQFEERPIMGFISHEPESK